MKKNKTTRLIVLALFVAIISAVIISGTFAKYTRSAAGQGTALIASWNVVLKKDGSQMNDGATFSLTDTTIQSGTIREGKIAPGTSGSFTLGVDATQSEVAVDYEITFKPTTASAVPTNLKFYSDSAHQNELTYDNETGKYVVSDTIELDGTTNKGTAVTITIYWQWPYTIGTGDPLATNDANDTNDGDTKTSFTYDVTLHAEQHDPSVALS